MFYRDSAFEPSGVHSGKMKSNDPDAVKKLTEASLDASQLPATTESDERNCPPTSVLGAT